MRDRLKEWGLAGAAVVIALIGVVIEVAASDVAAPPRSAPEGPRFMERAVFCPPSLPETKTILVAAATAESPLTVGVQPTRPEQLDLPAGQVLVQPLADERPADVVGFGGNVAAGALVRTKEPLIGEGSTQCSSRASARWFFGSGASTLGADQRMLIYNPFPDEAVVRVLFLTAGGENRKPALSDLPVPANSATLIRVNEAIRLQRSLAAVVEAERGRVVAWRLMFDDAEEGPSGVQMSLGVTRPFTTWYFPEGGVGGGMQEHIGIANPSSEEAIVTVSLVMADKVVQPDSLVEVEIPPRSSRTFPLGATLRPAQRDLGGVSALVQSTNNVGVVVERAMRYDSGSVGGSAAELGASRLGTRWLLTPGTVNPTTDSVVLMNPGATEAEVSLTLYRGNRGAVSPAAITGRTIPPGGRLKIGIGRWTAGDAVVVIVDSTETIAAERFSYSAVPQDVGASMGILLE